MIKITNELITAGQVIHEVTYSNKIIGGTKKGLCLFLKNTL